VQHCKHLDFSRDDYVSRHQQALDAAAAAAAGTTHALLH
jgi:hypothetical protein